jgi:hypothetical protein
LENAKNLVVLSSLRVLTSHEEYPKDVEVLKLLLDLSYLKMKVLVSVG